MTSSPGLMLVFLLSSKKTSASDARFFRGPYTKKPPTPTPTISYWQKIPFLFANSGAYGGRKEDVVGSVGTGGISIEMDRKDLIPCWVKIEMSWDR